MSKRHGQHTWGEWHSRGHGSGDGTPVGVVSTRVCVTCGAEEWRDSAVGTASGGTRVAHGWRDAYGELCNERPPCLGYDPHADDA